MNNVIKVLQQVSDTCERTRMCMKCEFYSKNSGMCVFADMPIFWKHEEIEKVLKEGAKMVEYIKRENVMQTLQKANIGGYITERLLEIPSEDVQPVKHGRWMYPFYCSECGFEPYYSSSDLTYNYCPNCGARMDLKDGERE